ncbi:hypothetical protein ISO99_04935 [Staphylococcus sp. 18_1_E_LY]|uniref:Uncharacterized protein n=1 Tax=Staphylococcus lloydii TaxID=2781774 RepID=A0A7T1F8W6_9STAP|nr:hypothetical protein [Staphylococcus lloydii]MBF7019252.1 hypothetical protein [Staphylococcus lloydii]MBF7026980.1 hypothetical protein [Staphylococcus lloydii]QPM74627.1 hypothetical protein ISP08_09795 [Staphylococcus lloydii]
MFKKKNKIINLKPLVESNNDDFRIPTLFLKLQKFFYENKISEEERKKLSRMLNAYYEG